MPIICQPMEERFDTDEIIFNQNDWGDKVYCIKEGEVIIRRDEGDEVAFLKYLKKGEWFGEIALVKNVPRTTSVIAASPVRLLTLSRHDFYTIIQQSLLTGVSFDHIADERLEELEKATAIQ
ncbi:MAG: cyclic nucleotide-binding domain-containing protein [Chitinivibrionales bacterium]|nr:cyclic nucleotide-binding domain-containing protein [Chitinivibrionales bacterium]